MPWSRASTGTVNVCVPSSVSSYGMKSSSEAAAASSPVPMYRYRYPVPPMVMTADMLPSCTVSCAFSILNMEELEETETG